MQLKKYLQMRVSEVKSISDMRDGISHTVKGKLDFAWFRYTEDFHSALQCFLDEKGVIYASFHPDMWAIDLILVDVPRRMYHEVVVPGMIYLCKQWKMIINPRGYHKCGPLREFTTDIKPDRDRLWKAAMKEYKDEHSQTFRLSGWPHVVPGDTIECT